MSTDRPDLAPNQEISWRLKELGPEMRRALFEKALHPNGAAGDAHERKGEANPADPQIEPPPPR